MGPSDRFTIAGVAIPLTGLQVAAAAVLVAAHLAVAVAQIPGHSAAADEPIQIASGYRMWMGAGAGDVTHPPLARYWFTAPILLLPGDPFPIGEACPSFGRDYPLCFITASTIDKAQLLFWPRLMAALVAAALLVVCLLWSRRLWGPGGALVTLALAAFSPAILADAPIAG